MSTKLNTKHLITIDDLNKEEIQTIFATAKNYLSIDAKTKKKSYHKSDLLKNKTIFNLFFEPSTRTRTTFELAAKNLGANVININLEVSSIKKGESVKDTILTLKSMAADCLVVRHKESGIAQGIADLCQDDMAVINAGDGINAHPTQALLDIFTILQHKPNIEDLKIVIIGDVMHSRVARSQVAALKVFGCHNIHIVGPENLLPKNGDELGENITVHTSLKSALENADVISVLRLQKERMRYTLILNDEDYFNTYGINHKTLKLAKHDAIVIHPGPINRNVEISSDVADGKHSLILEQVSNGVAIRMAIFDLLLSDL